MNTADAAPLVIAVNRPLLDFVRTLAGNSVQARLPVPAGTDPAHWSPTPEDIVAIQSADLILRNGAGYASWLDRGALPRSRMVDTSVTFNDRYIELAESMAHSHGDAGVHTHTVTAFTTWLDFDQARQQAAVVQDAMIRLRPTHRTEIEARGASLRAELTALDERMQAVAEQIGDRPLLASHPVYEYWARRYGLNVRSVVWEPGVVPDSAALDELAMIRATHPATIMIWEGVPLTESVEMLRERGLTSVIFTPHANPDALDGPGFIEQMGFNIDALAESLASGG